MEVAPVPGTGNRGTARTRNSEFAAQLRAAAVNGDDARITRLLSDLLRVQGLTRGQRISLQLRALQSLVQCLRSASLCDELTGLYNRRGFVQTGTRVLDLAVRDAHAAHLIYFDVGQLRLVNDDTVGAAGGDVLIRHMGNLMRDLFPGYGVYEVLGRLARNEFAALTTSPECATRSAIMLRTRRPQRSGDIPALPLRVGVAHFNPSRPIAIDELLENARRAVNEPDRVSRIASSPEFTPRTA
jgi:diguanylate cyclase (GGDEF)-like protein